MIVCACIEDNALSKHGMVVRLFVDMYMMWLSD